MAVAVAAASAIGTWLTTTAVGSMVGNLLLSTSVNSIQSALQRNAAKNRAKPGIQTEYTSSGGLQAQSFVIGRYATAGHMVCPPMSHGKQKKNHNVYLTYVISLGNIPGQTIEKIMVDDKVVEFESATEETVIGGLPIGRPASWYQQQGLDPSNPTAGLQKVTLGRPAKGDYKGSAWLTYYDGTQTAADPYLCAVYGPDSPWAERTKRPWTPDMAGIGTSYAILTFKLNEQLYSGLPRCRFVMGGIPLYDPRRDTTAGGDGAQRWADRSTWQPSHNPIVQIYNIMRGITIAGGPFWGYGVAPANLPLSSWFPAMNACDVPDDKAAPIFRAGFEISVDKEPADIIDELLKVCGARLAEHGGVWKVRVGAVGAPVFFLTDDNIVFSEAASATPFPGLEQTYNGVSASYPDPDQMWQPKDAPPRYNVNWEALDLGRRRMAQLTLSACPYPDQVQRLMRGYIEDERRFRRHVLPLPPEASVLEALDAISWSSAEEGYENKIFEIGETSEDLTTGITSVALREADPADYSWRPDFLLPTAPAPVADLPPAPISPEYFTVEGIPILDADGNPRRPAARLRWGGWGLEGITSVRWEIVQNDQPLRGVMSDPDQGEHIVRDLLPGASCTARIGFIGPNAGRDIWTEWKPFQTPDVRIPLVDIDTTPPGKPALVELTTTVGKVVATWQSVGADTAYSDLEVIEGSGNPVWFQTGGLRYEFSPVTAGLTYQVRRREVDRVGNKGPWSDVASIVAARDTVPPAAPTGLAAVGSFGAITLKWNANTEADFAYYEVAVGTAANPTVVASKTPATTSIIDGLADNTTRHVRIRAVDTSGNVSGWSAGVSAASKAAVDTTITTEKLKGLVDATSFGDGVEPIKTWTGAALPTTKQTTQIWWKGRTYKWDGSKYVDLIAASELSGTIADTQLAQNLEVIKVHTGASLPTTRIAGTISWNGKPYIWDGSKYVQTASTADLTYSNLGPMPGKFVTADKIADDLDAIIKAQGQSALADKKAAEDAAAAASKSADIADTARSNAVAAEGRAAKSSSDATGAAALAAESARLTALVTNTMPTPPSTFGEGLLNWTGAAAGSPATVPPLGANVSLVNDPDLGPSAQWKIGGGIGAAILPRAVFDSTRRWRYTITFKVNSAVNTDVGLSLAIYLLDQNYAYSNGMVVPRSGVYLPGQTYTLTGVLAAAAFEGVTDVATGLTTKPLFRPGLRVSAANKDGVISVKEMRFEDVTSELAAKAAASASVTSAASAQASKKEAGDFATATKADREKAETAKAAAEAASGKAAESETNAKGFAATAQEQSTLSAKSLTDVQKALANTSAVVAVLPSASMKAFGTSYLGTTDDYSTALPDSAYGSDAAGPYVVREGTTVGHAIVLRSMVPSALGNVYRVTARVKVSHAMTLRLICGWVGSDGNVLAGAGYETTDFAAGETRALSMIFGGVAGGVVTATGGSAAHWAAAIGLRFGVSTATSVAGSTYRLYEIRVDDLTGADQAARQAALASDAASAASDSWSKVSASEKNAKTYADAASGSKDEAITAKGLAERAAGNSATSETNAAGSANAASSYANLAALALSGGMAKNPTFLNWTGAAPPDTSLVVGSYGTAAKVEGKYGSAVELSSTSTGGTGPYIQIASQNGQLRGNVNPKQVLVTAEIEPVSGSMIGALVDVAWGVGTQWYITTKRLVGSLTFGSPQTVQFALDRPAAAANATVLMARVYVSNPTGGAALSVGKLRVHRFDVQEIVADSIIDEQRKAKATLDGLVESSYVMRVKAGGAMAGFEMVAANNPTGPASAIRMSADEILLDGSVKAKSVGAGEVRTEHLASEIVTASKVAITDATNLVPDDQIQDAAAWFDRSPNVALIPAPSWMNSKGAFAATPSSNYTYSHSKKFAVVPGESLYASFQASFSNNNAEQKYAAAQLYFFKGSTYVGAFNLPANTVNTATVFEATGTVPAGADNAFFRFWLDKDRNTGNVVFGSPVVRIRARGELIVDGAVTAKHVAADAITTPHIQAGAVLADQMGIGFGGNLLANSDWGAVDTAQKLRHWYRAGSSTAGAETSLARREAGSSYAGTVYPTLMLFQNGAANTGYCDLRCLPPADNTGVASQGWPVQPGAWVEVSTQLSVHRCTAELRIEFRKADGSIAGYAGLATQPEYAGSTNNPDTWPRIWTKAQAPAEAAYAVFHLRKTATRVSPNSYVFVHKPMMALSGASNTQPSPYAPSSFTFIDGEQIITNSVKARAVDTEDLAVSGLALLNVAYIREANITGTLTAAILRAETALHSTITVEGRTLGSLSTDTLFDDATTPWTFAGGSGDYLFTPSSVPGTTGNSVLLSRANGANQYFVSTNRMSIDGHKLYRVQFKIRRNSAGTNGIFYLGLAGYTSADKLCNTAGAESLSNQCYLISASQGSVSISYTVYTAYVRGLSSAPGGAGTVDNPRSLHSNVRYVRPIALFQYPQGGNASDCEMVFDDVRIEPVSDDGAALINAGLTQIDPGKIFISSGRTLADWRYGGDYSLFDGGNIAANTMYANAAVFGMRNLSLIGIQFEHNSPSLNKVSWTGGTIRTISDTGAIVATTIPAGSASWSSGVLYIYYPKGGSAFLTTTSQAVAMGPDAACIATYGGGASLNSAYGRVVIDGNGGIKAESVDASRLVKTQALITEEAQIKSLLLSTPLLAPNAITRVVSLASQQPYPANGGTSGYWPTQYDIIQTPPHLTGGDPTREVRGNFYDYLTASISAPYAYDLYFWASMTAGDVVAALFQNNQTTQYNGWAHRTILDSHTDESYNSGAISGVVRNVSGTQSLTVGFAKIMGARWGRVANCSMTLFAVMK